MSKLSQWEIICIGEQSKRGLVHKMGITDTDESQLVRNICDYLINHKDKQNIIDVKSYEGCLLVHVRDILDSKCSKGDEFINIIRDLSRSLIMGSHDVNFDRTGLYLNMRIAVYGHNVCHIVEHTLRDLQTILLKLQEDE